MKLHSIPGTDLQLSTFCCGLGDLFTATPAESDRLLDAYVEAGGNFFDTAHAYSFWVPGGNGLSEIGIGDYVRRRGLKNAVIATKGGHRAAWRYRNVENHLSAERIRADIDDSLARLECDTITLYYLHVDDERMPVSEILGYLNAEIRRGRIRYLGASNWSAARLAEAADYARKNNLQTFVISSPRWCLAENKTSMGLNAPGQVEWHRQGALPVAPYCPTAQGFFSGKRDKLDEAYDLPENHARRSRVDQLAKELGFTPTQIAVAWLLSHPFLVLPILGSKRPERLHEALGAEAIHLSEQQMAWLDRGDAA